jgi:hypothetical protein
VCNQVDGRGSSVSSKLDWELDRGGMGEMLTIEPFCRAQRGRPSQLGWRAATRPVLHGLSLASPNGQKELEEQRGKIDKSPVGSTATAAPEC